MPFYLSRGNIPPKRHIQHRKPDGDHYYEEHISRKGFSDIYSNVYHVHPPTRVSRVGAFRPIDRTPSDEEIHRHHHLETFGFKPEGNWIDGRKPIAFNNDLLLSTAAPVEEADFFYRNGEADELIFIHRGSGTLESQFGSLDFGHGDYIVIPRGLLHRIRFTGNEIRLFIAETRGAVDIPRHYRNRYGQLLEEAPYCERDIRVPEFTDAIDEKGDFPIRVRVSNGIQEYILAHHPFDVVGWDGLYYPWSFNIGDFMPKVGKVHLPPPAHLTFSGEGFVICSFVPRLFDFHEEAVPIPYAHSNVDSDEVIYYVEGKFMSRKGIREGSITLHPSGLPHGPQPGLLEASLGKRETHEYAVMVDTFRPLRLTRISREVDDENYPYSWLEEG
jgi:homogentisate 1,2-dioxygenase